MLVGVIVGEGSSVGLDKGVLEGEIVTVAFVVGVTEGKGVTVFVGAGDSVGTDVADGDEVASSNLVAVGAAAAGVDGRSSGVHPTSKNTTIAR